MKKNTRLDKAEQLAVIDALRRRLDGERRWTRHVLARTSKGKPCTPCHPDARQWCLSGAIYKTIEDLYDGRSFEEVDEIAVRTDWFRTIAGLLESVIWCGYGGGPLESFNDIHDWRDVSGAIDEVKHELEEQQGKRK